MFDLLKITNTSSSTHKQRNSIKHKQIVTTRDLKCHDLDHGGFQSCGHLIILLLTKTFNLSCRHLLI